LFREALPAAELHSFQGILNSTTNIILSRMERGETFDQAVAYCQSIGVAEADPANDVDGWDAAIKVAALVTVLWMSPAAGGGSHRHPRITSELIAEAGRRRALEAGLHCPARGRGGGGEGGCAARRTCLTALLGQWVELLRAV
jgi:homoserine dehydrogenase